MDSTVDSSGNVTTTVYNADDEECWTFSGTSGAGCQSSPSGSMGYTYDSIGNVLTQTDQSGSTTQYTYADHVQPTLATQIVRPNGQGSSSTTTEEYDPAGHEIEGIDPNGVTTYYAYNANGKECLISAGGTALTSCATAPSSPLYQAYNYDADSEVCWEAVNHFVANTCAATNGATTISYSFASPGWMASVKDANNKTTSFDHDVAGNLSYIAYPTGNLNEDLGSYGYNAAGEIGSVTDFAGTPQLSATTLMAASPVKCSPRGLPQVKTELSYTYDPANVVTSESTGTVTAPTGSTTNLQRNADELISSSQTTGGSLGTYGYSTNQNWVSTTPQESDGYNANGTIESTTTGSAVTTFAYEPDGELCWTAPAAISGPACSSPPASTTNMSFDSDGNRILSQAPGASATTYGYNQLGQLASLCGSDHCL